VWVRTHDTSHWCRGPRNTIWCRPVSCRFWGRSTVNSSGSSTSSPTNRPFRWSANLGDAQPSAAAFNWRRGECLLAYDPLAFLHIHAAVGRAAACAVAQRAHVARVRFSSPPGLPQLVYVFTDPNSPGRPAEEITPPADRSVMDETTVSTARAMQRVSSRTMCLARFSRRPTHPH
jgi:hypothetical protein